MRCAHAPLIAALCLLALGCQREPASSKGGGEPAGESSLPSVESLLKGATKKRRLGGLDATFYVTADTHFGYGVPKEAPLDRDVLALPLGVEKTHQVALAAMDKLPGQPYPAALGGVVGTPLGVLIAGDLTESGQKEQWAAFLEYYGSSRKLPMYEGVGNHDFWDVRQQAIKRHGALWYSWNWGDLHVVCLGEAPDSKTLSWLEKDLAGLEKDVPIVMFLHFPFKGPFSNTWFTRDKYDDKLFDVIQGYTVLGFFHGHYHGSGRYKWRGYNVYNVGSAKHRWHSFGVARVTDTEFAVASWDYDRNAWEWWQKTTYRKSSPPNR
ncbi:MAG: metallophosphoesterase [Polyangiaceae bacterium]